MTGRLVLRHLSFVGAKQADIVLKINDGTNVIYGASNTGKSFTLAALQFMFGKSTPLPVIEQIEGYDAILLGLNVPTLGEITIYRGVQGGGLKLYDGLHLNPPTDVSAKVLDAEFDVHTENISTVLLGALGLGEKLIVRNENGEKVSFTLRTLDPYLFVDESAIIDARSPILSGQYTTATIEKNAFRLLLTGRDDSAVVAVMPPKIRKARQEGQRELLEQWIADLDVQIDATGVTREQLTDQETRIETSLASLQNDMANRQSLIDDFTRERRRVVDESYRIGAEAREIELTLARFARLMDIYDSDVERLEALDQGGHLLLARLDRPCPLCGAEAEHQRSRSAQDVARARTAARAEITRIYRERQDLVATISGLELDGLEHLETLAHLGRRRDAADRALASLRPDESSLRESYEQRLTLRDLVRDRLKLFEERDRLVAQLSQIASIRREKRSKLPAGIDGPTGHEFAGKVSNVLREWKFPGDPAVSFYDETQDIRLNGKDRSANGKGVRAILHSAFKVAVLLFCQENKLPHPGVLVLDTPLLTYREPLSVPRHGELAADERNLAATTLHEHFYRHLASLQGCAQFIILENSDPPPALLDMLFVQTFTGDQTGGRSGLFPAVPTNGA